MPIKYKLIQKGQPGIAGGGTKKYYASPVVSGEANMADIIKSIERFSSLSGGDIQNVLYSLVDVIVENLSHGRVVKLHELGNMRISLSSEGKTNADEFTSAAIKGASVVFTPGARIKDMLFNAEFQKD